MTKANRLAESRILIVDDIGIMRRVMENSLKEIGYVKLTEARDGHGALALLNQQEFDLVITDLDMPVLDGIGLLKAMKANERLAKTPVLVVSAETERHKIVSAITSGAHGYIIKPFAIAKLRSKINEILDKVELQGAQPKSAD